MSNPKIAILKFNAYKLHGKHQLPTALFVRIQKLNAKSSVEYIRVLSQMSEHYLRVEGYYKKYPDVHKMTNDEIEKSPFARSNDQKGLKE